MAGDHTLFGLRGKKTGAFCWEMLIHCMLTGSSDGVSFKDGMTLRSTSWSGGQLRSLDFTSCGGHIHPWEKTSSHLRSPETVKHLAKVSAKPDLPDSVSQWVFDHIGDESCDHISTLCRHQYLEGYCFEDEGTRWVSKAQSSCEICTSHLETRSTRGVLDVPYSFPMVYCTKGVVLVLWRY